MLVALAIYLVSFKSDYLYPECWSSVFVKSCWHSFVCCHSNESDVYWSPILFVHVCVHAFQSLHLSVWCLHDGSYWWDPCYFGSKSTKREDCRPDCGMCTGLDNKEAERALGRCLPKPASKLSLFSVTVGAYRNDTSETSHCSGAKAVKHKVLFVSRAKGSLLYKWNLIFRQRNNRESSTLGNSFRIT